MSTSGRHSKGTSTSGSSRKVQKDRKVSLAMKLTDQTGDMSILDLVANVTVEPICSPEEHVTEEMGPKKRDRGKETSRTCFQPFAFKVLPFLFVNRALQDTSWVFCCRNRIPWPKASWKGRDLASMPWSQELKQTLWKDSAYILLSVTCSVSFYNSGPLAQGPHCLQGANPQTCLCISSMEAFS